jgi:deoxyribose-phosphate aldolase
MVNPHPFLADGVGSVAAYCAAAGIPADPAVWNAAAVAAVIDHTLLKPDATRDRIAALCDEAVRHGFRSVCIHPCWVPLAAGRLEGTGVKACTVVGFPLGAGTSRVKGFEAADALGRGARELDLVINVGALKSGDLATVEADLRAVAEAAAGQAVTKAILETCLLTDDEKRTACRLAADAGIHFVKTATGFAAGGATPGDVRLLRAAVGERLGVKASGGVRNLADLVTMVAHGATRIGTSAGVAILQGCTAAGGY